jgi:hypothetical protein
MIYNRGQSPVKGGAIPLGGPVTGGTGRTALTRRGARHPRMVLGEPGLLCGDRLKA